MNTDILNFLNFAQGFWPYGLVKILMMVLLGIYIIFAGILVREEQLISRMVQMAFSPILRGIVFIHLLAAISIFILALMFL
jgi:hypothetical protein